MGWKGEIRSAVVENGATPNLNIAMAFSGANGRRQRGGGGLRLQLGRGMQNTRGFAGEKKGQNTEQQRPSVPVRG